MDISEIFPSMEIMEADTERHGQERENGMEHIVSTEARIILMHEIDRLWILGQEILRYLVG